MLLAHKYIKIYTYIYILYITNIREGMREEREGCRKEREREREKERKNREFIEKGYELNWEG